MKNTNTYTAFTGNRLIVSAHLRETLIKIKESIDRDENEQILIFEDQTGKQVDFDLRGTLEEVLTRTVLIEPQQTIPPKLEAINRDVSLLARHWEWLNEQPNGASAAIRRLIEEAKKRDPEKEVNRKAIEATSKIMSAIAGDLPGFEEASRALFAKNKIKFEALISSWPTDIKTHLWRLAHKALN